MPNLVDLLENLPADQINADNLQKIFRDSVVDRRALLTDFSEIINKVNFLFFQITFNKKNYKDEKK